MSTIAGNHAATAAAGQRRWLPAAACICIAGACILAFANSLNVPFFFDDIGCIVENQTIRSLTDLRQILATPRRGFNVEGRPVINLTFALNYVWSGLDVRSWHAVNIAIHILSGFCLFGIARRTLLSPRIRDAQRRRATPLAFAIALLWTLHPLQTESVTYVTQRTESLVGLFLLATLYCSIRAADSSCRLCWSIAAVAFCGLGMGSKEVMVCAPLLVVLYDWTFSGHSTTELLQRRGGFYASLAATWIILAILVLDSVGRGGSAGFGLGMTSWEYARTQFGFIVRYLRLAFWPHPLVMDYGDQIVSRPAEIIPAAVCVGLLVGAMIVALASRRYRPAGFLGAWFFCILAPSSSVVPLITQTGAEHRMYLPLAAVVVLVVVTVDRLIPASTGSRRPAFIGAAMLGLVSLGLGAATARRNVDYQSALAIWRDTVEKCPENWRALCNLADEYSSGGDLPRAIEYCNQAIRVNPRAGEAFSNRGAVFMRLGDMERARRDLERAIELNPKLPVAHANLGIIRQESGELESALSEFSIAISLTHVRTPLLWRRAVVLIKLGRYTEAIDNLSEAIRLDPQFDRAWNARAECYRATQQLPRAIADLSRAIEVNPRASYYLNRGIALGMAGRFQESVDDCSAALRLDPDFLEAYRTRALSYVNLERPDLARADLAQMERLGSPPDPRVLKRLD